MKMKKRRLWERQVLAQASFDGREQKANKTKEPGTSLEIELQKVGWVVGV